MPEVWERFYDEIHRRAERVPEQHFDRSRAFAEAAHEAYRSVADGMSAEGESDDHTLHVMHHLNTAVKSWIECDSCSWENLRERLAAAWEQLNGRERVTGAGA